MTPNFQRNNSLSNAAEGKQFELIVKSYFNKAFDLELIENIKVDIGISTTTIKKAKAFDLGIQKEIIVECKSHSWREGGNVPSAKLTTWNEAMYLFFLVPKGYRKLFVVESFFSEEKQLTLAEYYLLTFPHLIPDDVEIWEFDRNVVAARRLK